MLVTGTLWLVGCGGSADDAARKVGTSSVIAKKDPIQRYVVRGSAIEEAPRRSAQRAFLQYWSNLQFQAWSTAAQTYEPALRRFIGDDVLIRALANQAGGYLSSGPDIVSTEATGDRALIRYYRVGAGGTTACSISLIRDRNGHWLIDYDPLLDQALAELKQLETQQALDPVSQKPTVAALRAGQRARKLQSQYVSQRRNSG